MTKKEYIIDEPYELTATPISWLEGMTNDDLSSFDDILLVASKPDYQVQDTGYQTKKLSLKVLKDALYEQLSADVLNSKIDQLCTLIDDVVDIGNSMTALLDDNVQLSDQTGQPITLADPYVISALAFKKGNITSLSGYSFNEALVKSLTDNQLQNISFGNVQCDTLMVGDPAKQIHAIEQAEPGGEAGTVKLSSSPSGANVSYVQIDQNGCIYVSRQQIEELLASKLAALSAEIVQTVTTNISRDFYKTVVGTEIPSQLMPNTIYFKTSS